MENNSSTLLHLLLTYSPREGTVNYFKYGAIKKVKSLVTATHRPLSSCTSHTAFSILAPKLWKELLSKYYSSPNSFLLKLFLKICLILLPMWLKKGPPVCPSINSFKSFFFSFLASRSEQLDVTITCDPSFLPDQTCENSLLSKDIRTNVM